MGISVRFEGAKEAIATVTELPKALESRVINEMSQIAYDRMLQGARRHNKTGALFQSIYNRQLSPNSRQVGHDETRAPHAKFILYGTKDHRVAPKNKKALRWASGGKFFFSKGHDVKGVTADNYLEAAATEAISRFAGIVDNAIKGL